MPKIKGSIKTGGRKKGTPNKATLLLQSLLDDNDLDPIKGIKEALNELAAIVCYDPETKITLANSKANIYLDLMQYVYPKRKSIDHDPTHDDDDKVQIIDILWSDDESPTQDAKSNPSSKKDK